MDNKDSLSTIDETAQEVTTPAKSTVAGGKTGRFLAALSAALSAGDITHSEARTLRARLGITKSFFTKKRVSKAKTRRRALIAKASRKANRGLGKGEKRSSGRW